MCNVDISSKIQFKLTNPISNGTIRGSDKWGSGHYGARRGARLHKGIDLVADYGSDVVSPINRTIVRVSYPYSDDLSYEGIVIKGSGVHSNIEIKMFYLLPMSGIVGTKIKAGEKIGTAQNLTGRYKGITNHIHMELEHNGVHQDPSKYLFNR